MNNDFENKKVEGLITLKDLPKVEILNLIGKAKEYAMEHSFHEQNNKLRNKTILIITDRTKPLEDISLQIAIKEMGGKFIFLHIETLDYNSFIKDVLLMKSVQSYDFSAIIVNTSKPEVLNFVKANSSLPILNLNSTSNPCDSLALLLTLQDKYSYIQKLTVGYIATNFNDNESFLYGLSKFNVSINLYGLNGEEIPEDLYLYCKQFTDINICKTLQEAVINSDIVYFKKTDLSLSQEDINTISEGKGIITSLPISNSLLNMSFSELSTTLNTSNSNNLVFAIKAVLNYIIK